MRVVFTGCLVSVLTGLAYFIAVGLLHR